MVIDPYADPSQTPPQSPLMSVQPPAFGPARPAMAPPAMQPPSEGSVGGLMTLRSLSAVMDDERSRAHALAQEQSAPAISELAAHIRKYWGLARSAKQLIYPALIEAVYSRRGEYTPEKLAKIAGDDPNPIYMMLFASKSRQVKSLLVDALLGNGSDKPWTLRPTENPDLPEDEVAEVMREMAAEVYENIMGGTPMTQDAIRVKLRQAKAIMREEMRERAKRDADNAEDILQDALQEGGFREALLQFLDDLPVFKTAFLKGPVLRNKPRLRWEGRQAMVEDDIRPEWERVDPFNIYPAPWSKTVDDGPLIERHRLSRSDLSAMIGVPGYSDTAIRQVLMDHGVGGLHQWVESDNVQAAAEGKQPLLFADELIDALQFWGSVSGKMLVDWGMSKEDVPDQTKEYHIEAWLIGNYVIKASINPDPLGRRPYFAASFSQVAGAFWGVSLYDIVKDCQDMCNAAARAIARNIGLSSGPQVVVNTDALPPGEDITSMYPWKIWQTRNDPINPTSSAQPVRFFQPSSNASELMAVYQQFANYADEYSGIPRYMTGSDSISGVGRTASGLSLMVNNAGKSVKELIGNLDRRVLEPCISRLYQWLLMFRPENGMSGDINIVARGAMALIAKDAIQIRRNEFLQATANPIDMQIIGPKGRAMLLREVVKTLDMNTDDIIADVEAMEELKNALGISPEMMQQQQQAQQQGQMPQQVMGSGDQLPGGAPVVNSFQS